MGRYFLDFSDRRLLETGRLIEGRGKEVLDFESSLHEISSGDICVVSPSYKWKAEILCKIADGVTIYGGAVAEDLKSQVAGKKYVNLLENERFVVQNARLTAEAFLAEIISHSTKSLFEQRILVLGSGRVAKAVWKVFGDLGVKFDSSMRNEKERAISELYCGESYFLNDIDRVLWNYNSVINTIPFQIFSDDLKFKSGANVYELASKKCLGEGEFSRINYVICPSLPAKYMPVSAGKLIFDEIVRRENI